MEIRELINLAEAHVAEGAMASSARLALEDAKRLAERGEIGPAYSRALTSLSYSVGVFHADYQKANRGLMRARRGVWLS